MPDNDPYKAELCDRRYEEQKRAAQDALEEGDEAAAADHYERAADWLAEYAALTNRDRADRVETLRENAQALREGRAPDSDSGEADADSGPGPAGDSTEAGRDDSFDAMAESFIARTAVDFDDIGGLDETKERVCHEIGLGAHPGTPPAASGTSGVLLFGPPGTGKTLLASAVAGGTETTFFDVKLGGLLSKWHGESSKRVSALFDVAREMTPAVVFLDEIDALTQARGGSSDTTSRRVLNTLLAELDGLGNDTDGFLLVMGSTNRPMDLDDAVVRRFPTRIHVPLPDVAAATEIVRLNTVEAGVTFEGRGRAFLPEDAAGTVPGDAEPTEAVARVCVDRGFTGSDVAAVCRDAVSAMMQRVNPDLGASARQGLGAVESYDLDVEPLAPRDVRGALDQAAPSLTEGSVAVYEEWAAEHGTG
jgi:katanin p60 ATPase-containing subunit A1